MSLDKEKVRREKNYMIGYMARTGKYVLVTVHSGDVWYYRYFRITEAEYELFETDIEKLDNIADEVYREASRSERFLYTEAVADNELVQKKLEELYQSAN